MNITGAAVTSSGPLGRFAGSGGAAVGLGERQSDFASILARASGEGKTEAESARGAAEQFVSITLVQPLLASLRKSNGAAPPFAPSQGERQFQGLMDAHVAHQVVKAAHFPLVERLARQLLGEMRRGGDSPGAPPESSTP